MQSVVAHSVNPFLFGSGTWVYSQLTTLTRWRAIVVCKRRENERSFPLEDVHALLDLPLLAQVRERIGRRLSNGVFPFMRREIQRAGARLIHSHFASQGWTDLPLARATGLPLIASFYGADIWKNSTEPGWRERYARLFEAGALFLVEGNAMRGKVIALGCAPEKVVVQHLGVDVNASEFRERRVAADGCVRVLVSGRAVEKKGHEMALEVFAKARASMPALRLSMMIIAASTGEQRRLAALRERVRELRLEEAIDFPPPRSYNEYRRAMYDYHLFLAPSLHARNGDAEGGAPVSITDMSATGMPIVASRHCDIPEVAPHEVSGLLFDEGDVDGAVDALLRVAGDPASWPRYGRAGRAHIERAYSIADSARALEDHYDRVAAR